MWMLALSNWKLIAIGIALAFVGYLYMRVDYLSARNDALETELETAQQAIKDISEFHVATVDALERDAARVTARIKVSENKKKEIANAPRTEACVSSPAISGTLEFLRDGAKDTSNQKGNTK